MTLDEMVKKYGADASRIALADAGDGVADENFEEDVADNNVLRLFTLREWCEEQVKDEANLRSGPKNDFLDALFENEMIPLFTKQSSSTKTRTTSSLSSLLCTTSPVLEISIAKLVSRLESRCTRI